ncbi:hypothetical protein PLICRDRAFT_111699 [Plicaturopsis crispa FD-325 SS-3]|nr:hypothetical protein PLICRDRAFT_111699 [Plicaturopsis crispa FD-325 SS-3]
MSTGPDAHVPALGGELFTSAILPCGISIRNRLVKVALEEHLATLFGGPPNATHLALYSEWAKHNWGMIVTGNVQVSDKHLTLGRDIVVPKSISRDSIRPFAELARTIHGCGDTSSRALAIMQLSHAGRQSPNILGGRFPFAPPLAPSSIPFGSDSAASRNIITRVFYALLFTKPRAMTVVDIDEVVDAFVRGAVLASEAGFDGVQLHVAHGYLLAQFMSAKTNIRTDEWGQPLRLLHRIINAVRAAVPTRFALGLKVNASDYVGAVVGEGIDSDITIVALNHVREIASWGGVDFIEISGGDYEDPEFVSSSTSPRQAFFARFSHQALTALASSTLSAPPLVLLTGGLRTPFIMHTALSSRHADLLGVGRGAVLRPDLPEVLQHREPMDKLSFGHPPALGEPWPWMASFMWTCIGKPKIKLVGATSEVAWYVVRMRWLAINVLRKERGQKLSSWSSEDEMSGLETIFHMWWWAGPGSDDDAPHASGIAVPLLASAQGAWPMAALLVLAGIIVGYATVRGRGIS